MPRRQPTVRRKPSKQKTTTTAPKSPGQIEMKPVVSSNLESVGYNTETEELYVKFKGSGTYKYSGVPVSTYNDLLSAGSAGKYFHSNVRNVFPYEKV